MSDWHYLLAVAVIVGIFAGLLARRRPDIPGLISSTGLAIGALSTVVLLAIALMLTGRLWQDVRAQVASAPAPAGSASTAAPAGVAASQAGGVAPRDDGAKDALSNAMTAIGTVIAVVALILSVGTTWFADRLRTLERERERMESLADRVQRDRQREVELERKRTQALDALPGAKLELSSWVRGQGSSAASDYTTSWCLLLEMLVSDDRSIRFRAYSDLLQALRRNQAPLTHIRRYSELCHDLALERMQYDRDGKLRPPRDVLADVERGLWCLLFDTVERARYAKMFPR